MGVAGGDGSGPQTLRGAIAEANLRKRGALDSSPRTRTGFTPARARLEDDRRVSPRWRGLRTRLLESI